jgi:hypothetical protein
VAVSLAPFDVQPVVDRLKAQVKSLRLVGVAADYAAVKGLRDFVPPSAYVLLARETFDANPPGHGLRNQQVRVAQHGRVALGVVVAARNYREQAGGQLAGALQTLLGDVRAALAGWVPDVSGARPLQLQRGDLLQYDDATALWCDVWTTQTFISAEAQP